MSQNIITKQSDTEFICKLCDMIEKYPQIINWNQQGQKMIIFDVNKMQSLILPHYFRHQNFSSFIRQLNMYDFHKKYKKNNEIAFENQFFKKNNQKNYHFIQRKKKIKQLELVTLGFKKKNQSTLKRLNKQSKIEQFTKQSIQSLMEFKYTAQQNTARIRQQLEKLLEQLKEFRSRKISQTLKQIKNNLLQELSDQLRLSKYIDFSLENSFLRQKENNPIIVNQYPQHLGSQFYLPYVSEDNQVLNSYIGCQNLGPNLNSFMVSPSGFWNTDYIHPLNSFLYNGQNVISDMCLNENLTLKQEYNKQKQQIDDGMSMEILNCQDLSQILNNKHKQKADDSNPKYCQDAESKCKQQ